jgi:long-chain-acyl-CoA dehydrogenase
MTFYDEDHEAYRLTVREFLRRDVDPHHATWEQERVVPRPVWEAAARRGLLGLAVPERLGGGGVEDYRYRMVVAEEVARIAATSFGLGLSLQDDVVTPYFLDLGNAAQHERWLSGLACGRLIGAIAMSEPGAGSDLQGIRASARLEGDDWVLSGQKTFISSGGTADVVVVVARTDPGQASSGLTLLVVERDQPGFTRGRVLDKVGLHAQDTAELFFDGVRVPREHVLGEEGRGFVHLVERLPRERLSIAVAAVAAARAALAWTTEHVFSRTAFGVRVGDLQNTRFVLAELETEVDVASAYVEQCALRLNARALSAVDAAKAKWFATELQVRLTSRCLQLFGGYGYMTEYPIARAFLDSRGQTISGGTTEVMKEIIGRDIAARQPGPGHTSGPRGAPRGPNADSAGR